MCEDAGKNEPLGFVFSVVWPDFQNHPVIRRLPAEKPDSIVSNFKK
jgi:hypothetical protein